MSQSFVDNLLACLYLLVWVLTFIWYQYRRNVWDGGSAIMGTYILYAIISIFSINDYMFNFTYEPLRVFPYIYLYMMLMVALSPTIYMHMQPVKGIRDSHSRILVPLSILIIICSLMLLPGITSNFGEGILKLFTDSDAGKDAYEEQLEGSSDAGSVITNIPAIIFNSLNDIAIFLAFYFTSLKKKNKLLIAFLFLSVFIGVLIPIMKGQRGGVIICMLTIILGYMMFQQFYSKRIVRAVRIVGIIGLTLMFLPVAAITFSRYSETNAGITGYLNWYVGQGNVYFNNYALNAGGTRNGDRTMNLFRRVIAPNSTCKNFVERRAKYHNLKIDDHYFTTFVGDFCIDFGPILTVVIFVFFNLLVLSQIRPRDGTISLHQMLLLYFTECICMQGGMTLFAYSDTANLRIITCGGLYFYLRYHEALLKRFPLVKNKSMI